jgi:hypothetical protein
MKFKTPLVSLSVLLMLTSCEDLFEDSNLQPDGSIPYIVVKAPTNSQSLKTGKELRISITASDKDSVDYVHFTVKESGAENPVVDFKKVLNKRVVEFDTLVSMSDAGPGTYTLAVDAADKKTNRTLKEVTVTVR